MKYYTYNTKEGLFTFVQKDDVLVEIARGQGKRNGEYVSTPLLEQAYLELDEYFNGQRKEFTVSYILEGTAFQIKVWKALCTIPYGSTCSYKQIAQLIGNEKACRAVGMANHRNPLPFIVPCHRIIGKNGSMTGYALGLDLKERLLKMEGSL